MDIKIPSRSVAYGVVCAALFAPVSPQSDSYARGAAIRQPEDLATNSTTIEFSGFGGFNQGSFSGAEYYGEFTRSETRLGIFDPLYVANRGKSSFVLRSSQATADISASCQMRKNTATIRVVSFDLQKMVYECDFEMDGGSENSRFTLGEPKREGFKEKLLARDRRRGEAVIADQYLSFESVHEYANSRLSAQAPLGYLLESGGSVIAAVDLLDWNPIVHVRNDIPGEQRQAVIVVALALAVLRDPANSALED